MGGIPLGGQARAITGPPGPRHEQGRSASVPNAWTWFVLEHRRAALRLVAGEVDFSNSGGTSLGGAHLADSSALSRAAISCGCGARRSTR
jgi:hypothetical protein